jgi:hypothetical protein
VTQLRVVRLVDRAVPVHHDGRRLAVVLVVEVDRDGGAHLERHQEHRVERKERQEHGDDQANVGSSPRETENS